MCFIKISRNDLCPCGSGKKYKKCCLLKEHIANNEESPSAGFQHGHGISEPFKSFSEDEAVAALDVILGIHRLLLTRKPHIKEYERTRKMHGEIMESMMKYYQDGKFVPEADGHAVQVMANDISKGERLVMINAEFDFDTSVGNQAFADMIVYKNMLGNNCITEDYINSKRFRKPEKVEFLQSMLDSTVGLFSITGVDRGEGYAYLEEVFRGDKFRITDIGLSGDPNYDRHYIYTRIITYRGININSGLNIVFSKNDPFIKEFIKRQKRDYNPAQELVRFTELYNRFVNDSKSVKVITR